MPSPAPPSKRFVQVPEQFRMFDDTPLAVLLPDAPVKTKPERKRLKRLCVDCGREMKGSGWRKGDRCKLCIPSWGDPAKAEAGICCQLRPGAVRCPVGAPCKAIPY